MATVLVIESDSALRAVYGSKIAGLGHSVTLVEDGKEGIYQARKLTPDLIMLDLELEDMEGMVVLKDLSINNKTKGIPVIVSSYHEDEETVKGAFELGAIDFVSQEKTTPNEYVGKVDAALRDLEARGNVKEVPRTPERPKVVDLPKERHKKELARRVKKFTDKLLKESRGVDPGVVAGEVRDTIEAEIKIKELTDLGIPRAQAEILYEQRDSPAKKVLIISDDEFFGRTYRLKLSAAGYSAFETRDLGSITALVGRLSPDVAILDVKYPKDLIYSLEQEGTEYIYMANSKKECGKNKSCFVRTETTPAAVVQAIKRKVR